MPRQEKMSAKVLNILCSSVLKYLLPGFYMHDSLCMDGQTLGILKL
jgi:hypothetical protein